MLISVRGETVAFLSLRTMCKIHKFTEILQEICPGEHRALKHPELFRGGALLAVIFMPILLYKTARSEKKET